MKTMFVAAVAVLMFTACAKKADEVQPESAAPIQAETVSAPADSSVKPVEGPAAK
jgi:predicted outer membrane protein